MTAEPGVLARLSSTITVEDGPAGYIQLWRTPANPNSPEACITLRPEAEAVLLDFLLARRAAQSGPQAAAQHGWAAHVAQVLNARQNGAEGAA